MGKEKRQKKSSSLRHQPLASQIEQANSVKPVKGKRSKKDDVPDEEKAEYLSANLSKKILEVAQEQQMQANEANEDGSRMNPTTSLPPAISNAQDEDSDGEDDLRQSKKSFKSEQEQAFEDLNLHPDDEQAIQAFMPADTPQRISLADLIMAKIREKKTELSVSNDMPPVDPKVIEVYRAVGQILSRYRSGKIPKAFKIIPNLKNWEEILYITDPSGWTAAAMYAATRIFASNLNDKMAQRFFNLILLPRVRDDIAEYGRLNFHLYAALKKALFKPAAFMRGIVLPLCEAGDCTLREAVIVSSVVARRSIPVLHSAAAILKIAEMSYTGVSSIFLRIFLNKKYSLPYRVIDAVCAHFIRFVGDKRRLPVLWHQCFLVFAQRYAGDLSPEQKDALMEVLRHHPHRKITPDIRAELMNAPERRQQVVAMST